MIGSPIENGNWDSILGEAYYTAAGSGEVIWTLIAVAICVTAIIIGGVQESNCYKKME